jgi:hypothetical protein
MTAATGNGIGVLFRGKGPCATVFVKVIDATESMSDLSYVGGKTPML